MPDYRPATSIDRYAVGTPSILGLAALDVGVDMILAAGIGPLREKSVALTDLFIRLVEQHCGELGLNSLRPRDPARRGSQVCYSHEHAYPVVQALIARGVIGDFRAPDILRFGFAPLYIRHVDVWDAVATLREVLITAEWRQEFRLKVSSDMSSSRDRTKAAADGMKRGRLRYGDYLALDAS